MRMAARYTPRMLSTGLLRMGLLGVMLACLVGCGEREVPAEQRLVRVTLSQDDRVALANDRYADFREAVIVVREMELARPVSTPSDPVAAETIASFNDRLIDASTAVVAIIREDGWTEPERRLMQRALRSASIEDLAQGDESPNN